MTALRSAVRENLGLEWPERADTSSSSPTPPVAAALEELEQKLMEAIVAVEQPPALACAAPVGSAELPMAVKNLYYSILSDHPEYKYAYDLTSEVGEDGLLRCKVSYMPYRTGAYPAGFQGIEVDGLDRLVEVARGGLSQESIPIRITEPTLTVDAMNRALQQVGGGWLLCQLSRDGTAITVTPQGGLSREEALNRLAQSECLARQVYEEIVTAEMGKAAQAEALYAYLTEQVRYDFRYYSQPGEMPYSATTAYGALHDHLAICGGYAQAFQMLLQQAEIPCITVSGKMGGENHMWVLAQVDGHSTAVGNHRLMERQGIPAPEVPGTVVHVAVDGRYAGYLVISDLPKEDAREAIAALKAHGVHQTVMLTGDSEDAARAAAEALGVDRYHAQLLPADKVTLLEQLLAQRSARGKVAFVGDGINDAPVLTRADIGIAMGALGSDAAIEAADIVLMDDRPSKLATAIAISRKTLRIVHQNIWFALLVKFGVLILGAMGYASMWAAVFSDVGVAFLAILNATRCLHVEEFR